MMKKFTLFWGILCLLLVGFPSSGWAQFDSQFYQPTKAWKSNSLPPHDDIWLKTGADTLHCIWCVPEGEPLATIFFAHGNFGNISYNDILFNVLVDAGYQVFAIDYPGFGHSSGTPTHVGIALSGQQAFDYLMRRNDVRGTKILLFGSSIGTQIATKLAKDNQEEVYGLILDSGMCSFTDMALLVSSPDTHEMIKQYVTSPYSAQADIVYLDGMRKLIMHSRGDDVVPFEQGERVYEAAPEPKIFLEYEGDHVMGLVSDKNKVLRAMQALLAAD